MRHPAQLDIDRLLSQCREQRTRGSGPGGQHRNKVETAIVLTHLPSGVTGSASERRSQDQNRQVAIQRLRVNLALALRTIPPVTPTTTPSTTPTTDGLTPSNSKTGVDEVIPFSTKASSANEPSVRTLWRKYIAGGRVRVNLENSDFPALLSDGLDRVALVGGDVARAAVDIGISTSQLVKFLRLEPAAWLLVAKWRNASGLRPLR